VVDGQHAFFKKSTHDSSEIKTLSRKPARQMLGGGGQLQVRAASALAAGCQAGQDLLSGNCTETGESHMNVLRSNSDKQNEAVRYRGIDEKLPALLTQGKRCSRIIPHAL
jgi:hypothetical protein